MGPVQAWIAVAPGWKSALAARVDAVIAAAVPGVERAVKWNSRWPADNRNTIFPFKVIRSRAQIASTEPRHNIPQL